MNDVMIKDDTIRGMIYEIRRVQVMMDSDLGKLFNIDIGNINKSMKRNIKRFPKEFCFQLTADEFDFLLFQDGRAKKHGGRTTLPYVYTEHGVAMLSSILHSDIAIKMSIQIINVFVRMRHFINDNKDIYMSINRMDNKITEHDEKINYIFSKFDKKEKLLLKGEVFDAYLDILDIMNIAKDNLIVLDNYADISFLDLIRNIDIEIDKYNKEYHNLNVIRNNESHDRFIVIDNNMIYQIGTSLNSVGEKITMIVKIEDKEVRNVSLNIINRIVKNK